MDEDPTATLKELVSSVDGLEEVFAGLFESPLEDTRAALEPIDRAKLDILLAYTINDLVWIYLKTKGIEPDTHDVSKELDRIKTYYGKVRDVENPESRRTTLDKAAAHRFITAAIPRSQRDALPTTSAQGMARAQADAAGELGDVGMSSRFRHVQTGGEKVLPGEDEPGAEQDEAHDDGYDEGDDDEDAGDGDSDEEVVAEAAAFFASLDNDIEDAAASPAPSDGTSRAKRKRAADLNDAAPQ